MSTIKELIELAEAGGEIRAFAILAACRQSVSEHTRPTIERVTAACAALPGFGEAGADEIDCAMGIIDAEAQAHADSLEQQAESPPADAVSVVEGQQIIEAEPPTLSRDHALANLNAADAALAASRSALVVATRERNEARTAMAVKLQEWVQGFPVKTHIRAAREVAATTAMVRAQQGGHNNPNTDGRAHLWRRMQRGRRRVARGDVMTAKGIMRLPSQR